MRARCVSVKASRAFVLGYFLSSWELAGRPHCSEEQQFTLPNHSPGSAQGQAAQASVLAQIFPS